jgi:hypothetical protein
VTWGKSDTQVTHPPTNLIHPLELKRSSLFEREEAPDSAGLPCDARSPPPLDSRDEEDEQNRKKQVVGYHTGWGILYNTRVGICSSRNIYLDEHVWGA